MSFQNIFSGELPFFALLILAPVIAELLSGATPPAAFFHPLVIVVFVAFHGYGAAAIRETTIKCGKGWLSVLILAAAYGIAGEGLAAKTFFNPNSLLIGELAWYGRWLGVKWVNVFNLTVYHAIYSITIPLILIELLFPHTKGKRLLSNAGVYVCLGLLALVTMFVPPLFYPFKPPLLHYLLTVAVIVLFVLLARFVPKDMIQINPGKPRLSPWKFGAAVALPSIIATFNNYNPRLFQLPILSVLAVIITYFFIFLFVKRHLGQTDNELHKLALVSGLLSPYILIAFFTDIASGFKGMSVVGIAFIIFLGYVRKIIIKRTLTSAV